MNRRGCGQHVSRVAEGGQVTHVGHVAGEAGTGTEGRGFVLHALGQLVEAIPSSFVSFGLARHLSVACLDAFLLHGQGPVDIVQLVVEAACVAHRVPVAVAPPERGGGGLAVRAAGACTSSGRQSAFGLYERSVLAVHLVVEPTGVAQVVARTVPPPKGSRGGTAVYALTAL